jgi:hypothetical protein
MMMRTPAARAAALALALAACDGGSPTLPRPVDQAELTFVRFALGAVPLQAASVSFWAVRGRDREAVIRYVPAPGEEEGEEFLAFKVPGGSLLRRPDGGPFAAGDSVLITVRVVDPALFLFEFQPSGLRFDPRSPARLEVSYREADRDYDGDGDEDGEDDDFERELSFWRQERPGEPWFRISTLRIEDLEEVEADITGFTRYAVAGN